MKVLLLNHYAGSPNYGMEHRPYYFAKELNKRGFDATIIAADFSHLRDANPIITNDFQESISDEVKYCWIKTKKYLGNDMLRTLNVVQYTLKLTMNPKKITNKYNPDVIIASSPHPFTWVAGYRLAKCCGAKFIAETRDLWPEGPIALGKINRKSMVTRFLYKFEKYIYKRANRLIFTFPGGKDYVENIGLDSSKVRYINNGIDIDEFNDNKEKYIYEDIDLDDKSTFKILYTGSMGQANELIYVIKIAKRIKELGINDIKFILFGDGYQREKLEEYAKNNGLDNVIFKGKVEKKYIPNILSKSNLNIFTGKHIYLYKYGLSLNKMFDYFASGKPTLSNIECGYDILREYDCGIAVRGGSPEALAEGVLKFYNMPQDEYNRYCRNALKAAEDFDFKLLTDKLEKVILGLYPTKEGETHASTID